MSTFTVKVPQGYKDAVASRGNFVANLSKMATEQGRPGVWQIQEIIEVAGQRQLVVTQTPVFRPSAIRLELGPNFKPSMMEALESYAAASNRTVVEVKEAAGYAIAAALTPAIKTLRRSLATALKAYPHQIDINALWAAEGHLASIEIRRFPQMTGDQAEKVLREWLALVLESQRAASGWKISVSALEQKALMTYAAPDSLPKIISLEETFPKVVSPDLWSKIPLGMGPTGELVYQDLTATPHGLTAGPTGSGKTVALMALCANALLRGHRLCMLDPTKGGLDFLPLKPFAWAWATTLEDASATIQALYEEVTRRKAALQELGKVNWQSCSAEERARFNLVPITCLIDEFGSLALEIPVPKGLPKDDPLVEELAGQNAAKATIKAYVGKIAREARFAGIFLQVALQRPDTAIMGSGELRSNLSFRTQLVPKTATIEDTALRMLFDTEVLDSVRERVGTLADGTPGLAVVASEGGMAQGVKIPFMLPELIEEALRSHGLQPVETPLRIQSAPDSPRPTPSPTQIESVPAPAWASSGDPF